MKQFSDPIYHYIEVEPFAQRIIDTPYFYRLRSLRYLGTVNFVYSAADQTRFQHSLGVYHLTRYSLDLLNAKLNQDEKLPERTMRIVKVAALVHDIGHGPFSHLFDQIQLENQHKLMFPFKPHEEWSCLIFKRIVELNNLKENLGFSDADVESVCYLILGSIPDDELFRKYQFLNEIVSNSVSGLDTDKMDYLARDSYAIGNGITIEPMRIIQHQNLLFHVGKYYLSNSYKTKDNIELIYSSRKYMLKQIYRHPKVLAFDALIKDIFREALDSGALDLNRFYLSSDLLLPDDHIIYSLTPASNSLARLVQDLQTHYNPRVIFNYYFDADSLISMYPGYDREAEFQAQISKYAQVDTTAFQVFVSDVSYGIKQNDPAKFILFHANGLVYVPKEYEILYFNNSLTPLQRKQFLAQKSDSKFKETYLVVFCPREAPEDAVAKLRRGIVYFLGSCNALSCEASMLLCNTTDTQLFSLRPRALPE